MYGTAAIIVGLVAVSSVFGNQLFWDGIKWHRISGGGGMDPDNIRRHVYVLSEWCPAMTRVMRFGDEVIVTSQRPWNHAYPTNMSCTMKIGRDPDVGIIVSVLEEETPDCRDYMKIIPQDSPSLLYCGPRTNFTGNSFNYENETLKVEWTVPPSKEATHTAAGFQMLLTAYQTMCKPGQACFPCTNGLIIDQVHMCNGLDNCGDDSDERNCLPYTPPAKSSSATLTTVSVFLGIALVALAGMGYIVFNFYRQRGSAVPTGSIAERLRLADDTT